MKFEPKHILLPLACAFLFANMPNVLAAPKATTAPPAGTKDGAIFTPDTAAKLDKFLDSKYAEGNMVGYGLEVVDHGHIVYQKCYGKADLATGRPVDGRTVFGLASVTKTFTGLAAIYLMENHKLFFNDPISRYLKDTPKEWKNITVLELASMTAGFPHDVQRQDMPWKEQYELIKHQPLDFVPGTKYQYSNLSYRILGNIIEGVTGHSYMSVIHDVVLDPFDMDLTGTIEEEAGSGNLATPYVKRGNTFVPVKYKPSVCNYSAGMLASTLNDMAKYASCLLENRFPKSSSFGWLWFTRPPLSNGQPNPWAFGWGHRDRGNGLPERDAMNGGLPGVSSSIIVCPDDRLAVIALSNVRNKSIAAIAPAALRIIYNAPGQGDAPLEGEPAPAEDNR